MSGRSSQSERRQLPLVRARSALRAFAVCLGCCMTALVVSPVAALAEGASSERPPGRSVAEPPSGGATVGSPVTSTPSAPRIQNLAGEAQATATPGAELATPLATPQVSPGYVDGISDQHFGNWAGTFSESSGYNAPFPTFFYNSWIGDPPSHIKLSRYIVQWNVLAGHGLLGELTELEAWYANTVRWGLTPDLALTNYGCKGCKPPETTASFTEQLEALHSRLRDVSIFEAWNEPNHPGSGYLTEVAAAHFENAAYSYCSSHSCTAVAGNFLDEPKMVEYEEVYTQNLNPSDPGGNWGIHPYADVLHGWEGSGEYNTVEKFRNHLPKPSEDHIWFTEVGAYNCLHGTNEGLAKQEKSATFLVNTLIPTFNPYHIFYYQAAWPFDVKPPCTSESLDTALYAAESTNGPVVARPAATVIWGPEGPPSATTEAPSGVTEETATMNGSANPEGLDDAKAYFEYGTSTSYGLSTSEANVGPGIRPVGIAASFTGLGPYVTIHYRLVVKSNAGTSRGGDHYFTTPGPSYPLTAFYTGSSGTLQEDWWTGSLWGFYNEGTPIAAGSSPATDLFPNPGEYDVYFRGNNGELQEALYGGESGWHWYGLGHSMAADTTPTIRHPQVGGDTVLYYTGGSGTLQESWWTGEAWGYYNIGTPITAGSSPAADPHPNPNQDDVYFRGSNGELQEDVYFGEAGWKWYGLGHSMAADTTPTIRHPQVGGDTVLYYTGGSGTLQESWWTGEAWGYYNIGTPITAGSSPAADPHPNPGQDDVYFRGSNGELQEDVYFGEAGWKWYGLGHMMAAGTTPVVVRPVAGGRTYVFFVGSNGVLQEDEWTGEKWEWSSLGATVEPGTSPAAMW
jgi:hypothetical protein